MSDEESESTGFKSTMIGEIKLTDASTVRVSTFDGRDGKKRVDLRLFLTGAKYTGPTRKGVSLPVDQLQQLKALLEQVK
ncbi:MAG: transcriptional coactivator p15/PC4 family protein [Thaumarchaeota archaeon]|nr:transcriptional coactivator p15/PC4 family protein [Nitrososphaerota archaeon]